MWVSQGIAKPHAWHVGDGGGGLGRWPLGVGGQWRGQTEWHTSTFCSLHWATILGQSSRQVLELNIAFSMYFPSGICSMAPAPGATAIHTQLDSPGAARSAGWHQAHGDSHCQAMDTGAQLGLRTHKEINKVHLHRKRVAYTHVCEKPNALIHLSRTTVQIISLDTLILIHNLQCYGPYTNYCCSQQQMNINITVPSIIARGSN